MDLENERQDTFHYGSQRLAGELKKVTKLADPGFGSGIFAVVPMGRTLWSGSDVPALVWSVTSRARPGDSSGRARSFLTRSDEREWTSYRMCSDGLCRQSNAGKAYGRPRYSAHSLISSRRCSSRFDRA